MIVAVKKVYDLVKNNLSINREELAASMIMKDEVASQSPYLQKIFFSYIDKKTDSFIICSKYCDGGTLVDLLSDPSKYRYSFSQCIYISIGILKGIAILHSLGMAHNDIKSSNVLIKIDVMTGMSNPSICDFGCMDPVSVSQDVKAEMNKALRTSRLLPFGTSKYRDPSINSNKTTDLKYDLYR